MGKGPFFDDLVMEMIGGFSPLLEYLDVKIGHAASRRYNFHDHVVAAEAMHRCRAINQLAKFIIGIDVEDENTLAIQMTFRGSEGSHPIIEFQQMIHRVIGADDGVKGLRNFEPGHVLMEEFYAGQFLSGIPEHRARSVQPGHGIILGERQKLCPGATCDFQQRFGRRMVFPQQMKVLRTTGCALRSVIEVAVNEIRLHVDSCS